MSGARSFPIGPTDPAPKRVAIAGDWHGNQDAAGAAIHWAAGKGADGVLQLGDFGVWSGGAGGEYLDAVAAAASHWGLWVAFIDGNHEDFDLLESWPVQPDGTRRVRRGLTHLPRGLRWSWHGKTWLALGGATSLDRRHRRLHISWWPQEAITWGQAESAIAGGSADYMLTHDAPAAADVPGLDATLWDSVELLTAEQHRELVQHVVETVGPSHLWHGHMHVRYAASIKTGRGDCSVDGLDCDQGRLEDNVVLVDLVAQTEAVGLRAYTPLPCPECRTGKHYNCPGDTWDDELDALVDCPCYVRGHRVS